LAAGVRRALAELAAQLRGAISDADGPVEDHRAHRKPPPS
jgi:hypothetical protein